MAMFDELDEQAQQQWFARIARKRLDLSASVEETLIDGSVQEDQEPGEADSSLLPSKDSTLIPPRLNLQSKHTPVVHSQATSASAKVPSTRSTEVPTSVENGHRMARRTTKV